MGTPLFKLCSPCCNKFPVIERNGDTVTIYNPESSFPGRIEMPLRALEILLDPEQGAALANPGAQEQVLFRSRFIRVDLYGERVDLHLFVDRHSNTSFHFTLAEWNQLFGSDENRRLALESLRTNKPVVLKLVLATKAA